MSSYPRIVVLGAGLLLFLCFFFFTSGDAGGASSVVGTLIEYLLEPKLITGGGPFLPPSIQTLTDSQTVVKIDVNVVVTACAMTV
jgi:hypothetical protein